MAPETPEFALPRNLEEARNFEAAGISNEKQIKEWVEERRGRLRFDANLVRCVEALPREPLTPITVPKDPMPGWRGRHRIRPSSRTSEMANRELAKAISTVAASREGCPTPRRQKPERLFTNTLRISGGVFGFLLGLIAIGYVGRQVESWRLMITNHTVTFLVSSGVPIVSALLHRKLGSFIGAKFDRVRATARDL